MRSMIIHKGEAIREPTVHNSVRIPASLHAYARTHKISLSKTLTVVLAAAKAEDEVGVGCPATNQDSTPIGLQEPCNPSGSQENTPKLRGRR